MTARGLVVLALLGSIASPPTGRAAAPDAVAKAVAGRDFPWYDRVADRVRPVVAERGSALDRAQAAGRRLRKALEPFFKALDRFLNGVGRGAERLGVFSLGRALAVAILVALLVMVLVGLVGLYRRVDTDPSAASESAIAGGLSALANAPLGASATPAEWWRLALERRAAGDLSGAVIALFVSQLVSLERRGLLRFAPGRTARQYVRDLKDDALARLLGRSLALFEQVSYARRRPGEPAFERVWAEAERFHETNRGGKP